MYQWHKKIKKEAYQTKCTSVEEQDFQLHQKNPSELEASAQAPPAGRKLQIRDLITWYSLNNGILRSRITTNYDCHMNLTLQIVFHKVHACIHRCINVMRKGRGEYNSLQGSSASCTWGDLKIGLAHQHGADWTQLCEPVETEMTIHYIKVYKTQTNYSKNKIKLLQRY